MVRLIVFVIVLPAVVAAVLMYAGRYCSRRGIWPAFARECCGLALALGLLASWVAVVGAPAWPVAERWHRLILFAGSATGIGGAAAGIGFRGPRWTLAAGLGVFAALLVSVPGFEHTAWRGSLGLLAGITAVLLQKLAERSGSGVWWLGVAVSMGALAALLAAARFFKLAGVAATASVVALLAGALFRGPRRGDPSEIAPLLVGGLIPALALTGHAYNYGSASTFGWLLIALAPAFGLLGYSSRLDPLPIGVRSGVRAALLIVPCGLAVASSDMAGTCQYVLERIR